jgi:hypothetical protein
MQGNSVGVVSAFEIAGSEAKYNEVKPKKKIKIY